MLTDAELQWNPGRIQYYGCMNPVWFWLDFYFFPGVPVRPLQRAQLVPCTLGTLFMYQGCWWLILRFLIHHRQDGSHRDLFRLPHTAPQLSCSLLKHFFPHQVLSSKLGLVSLSQYLFPFDSLTPRSYSASEYLCAFFHTVWYMWRSAHKKNFTITLKILSSNFSLQQNPQLPWKPPGWCAARCP